MATQSSLTQVAQLGVEGATTPGVAVAATKLLQSLSLSPSPQPSNQMFRPAGQKFATVAALGRDWTQVDTPGQPVYTELPYPFSSMFGAATVTQPDAVNAPSVYRWLWQPSSTNADSRKTYTFEHGNASRARRASFLIWQAFGIELGAENVSSSGTAMARAMTDGVALTANPTALPLVPILRSQFSLYSDATSAGLGTTKLNRTFVANWNVGDAVNGVWPIDAALGGSYADYVETAPDATLALRPEADAQGDAFLADLRSGVTRFVRLEAVGPVIATTFNYRLRIDAAYKVRDTGGFDDETGVNVRPFTFQLAHDAGWGRAIQIELTTTTAAL